MTTISAPLLLEPHELIDGAAPSALRLLRSSPTDAGATIGVCEVAGRPTFGSFALED